MAHSYIALIQSSFLLVIATDQDVCRVTREDHVCTYRGGLVSSCIRETYETCSRHTDTTSWSWLGPWISCVLLFCTRDYTSVTRSRERILKIFRHCGSGFAEAGAVLAGRARSNLGSCLIGKHHVQAIFEVIEFGGRATHFDVFTKRCF